MKELVSIETIKEKVHEYIKTHLGEDKPIFDPIIRKEDGKYYLGFMIVDFVNEENGNFKYKRPTKWLLVDIVTGDLVAFYNSNEHDYIDTNKFPLNLEFDNKSSSILFNFSNLVLTSYLDWKKQIIEELNNKKDSTTKINNDELISPDDFVLANIDSVLDDLHNSIRDNLEKKIWEIYEEYYNDTFESLRREYIEKRSINKTLLTNYKNLIKYLWPDTIEIFNAFDNIE